MSNVTISDAIRYIGVDDKDIDLFESQYIVPNGVSYNSYVILDEKIVVMDTVDARKTDEWLEKLERELDGKTPDYLVISHLSRTTAEAFRQLLKNIRRCSLSAMRKYLRCCHSSLRWM